MMQPKATRGGGGEAEFLGAQEGGDRHVPPGLELTVGLQDHARAQVVHHQRLVGLRDASIPTARRRA